MRGYRAGERIPGTPYRFAAEIGQGGRGIVCAVEHVLLGAPAVMKLLHAELVDRGELAERMTREARTLARLRHPNIVEVRDGGITDEDPARAYFVMEPLVGMTLRELANVTGGVGVLAGLRLMIGVLEGLEHAHRAGVVHRDVKSDNVLLHRTTTGVMVPKVFDFGITHRTLGETTGGRLFGPPRYSAPEQLRGATPTGQSDVYAAGLLLYELVAGEAPFADVRELHAVITAHLTQELPRLSTKAAGVPRALDVLLASMTAKRPEDRPPTAFSAAVALREIRARLEASQARVHAAADFKTVPSPMDALLLPARHGAGARFSTISARTAPTPTAIIPAARAPAPPPGRSTASALRRRVRRLRVLSGAAALALAMCIGAAIPSLLFRACVPAVAAPAPSSGAPTDGGRE